ncbi:MAG: hypothetical protein ACFFAO_05540 [Candidatus Hermodarchaeota archaeon]
MAEKNKKDLWLEIPSYAWISLARRGMEKISLDQCFLHNCDNEDAKLLEPFDMKEFEDEQKHTKIVSIKCKKCNGVFKLKMETIKRVAKPSKTSKDSEEEEALSMGMVYALDEHDKNLGHIGYF